MQIGIKDYEAYENEIILLIKKVVKRKIDVGTGQEIVFYNWEVAKGDINLGSLAKPNKEILEIVYIPRKEIKKYFKWCCNLKMVRKLFKEV